MLTDFGIAKDLAAAVTLTRAGEAPATVAYASPEQLEGLPLDGGPTSTPSAPSSSSC